MGELQWALLIVCVVLVIALYVFSRRGKRDADVDGLDVGGPANSKQTDLFASPPPPPVAMDFDEFGVGRPRSRGQDTLPMGSRPMPAAVPPSVAALLKPLPGQPPQPQPPPSRKSPNLNSSAPPLPPTTEAPAPVQAPASPVPGKLIALIVAPTEETDILGPQLHQSLEAQGLRFGEGEVYHRYIGGRIVYSVAGLLKPGRLIPADAEKFSTRGLTVVMQLPGPVKAEIALDDMISTTRALATALRAEIFDARRERLTDEISSALRSEVQDWARTQKAA